jgi:hypothetical protein
MLMRWWGHPKWSILVVVGALFSGPRVAAQEVAASDLEKIAGGYEHKPSRSQFRLPKGWEDVRTETTNRNSFLSLRQRQRGIEVTVSWSPLRVKIDEAVDLEHKLLSMLYGADKVSKPETAKTGDKIGFKIRIDDGPTQNGREVGVVYLFETGPTDKERWKVTLRGTVPRLPQEASMQALQEVEALLEQFANLK